MNYYNNQVSPNVSRYQEENTVNIIELMYKILDNIIVIIIAAVVGAVLMGKIVGTSSYTMYYSTVKVYLINTNDDNVTMSDLQVAEYLVNDYLALFQTRELHERVVNVTGLEYSPEQLKGMVSAGSITETHIISITAKSFLKEEAKVIADAYARVIGDVVEEKLNMPGPQTFEEATTPVAVITSNEKQNLIFGAMIGVIVSCVVVVLQAIFDERIRTPEDVMKTVGVKTVGVLTIQRKTINLEKFIHRIRHLNKKSSNRHLFKKKWREL